MAMPFARWETPSIQVGLLEAIARARGYPATSFHLTLDFAKEIGPDLYYAISLGRAPPLGDWLFARAAFGEDAPDDEDGFLELASEHDEWRLGVAGVTKQRLRELRREVVPAFIDRLVREISWGSFRVVGFTSTFQQNAASFALAAAIKRLYPSTCVVFGGVNFAAEMGRELVRAIEYIDYAVIGEGDVTFPELLEALRQGRDGADVAGVIARRDGEVTPLGERPPLPLDELPIPDYSEYFGRARALGLFRSDHAAQIPLEMSRGCWWGQKHACSFCGTDVHGLRYRSKSATRVVREIEVLSAPHVGVHLEIVDSILEMAFLRDLFPDLEGRWPQTTLYLEVKANLTRSQVGLLKDAGTICIQPGIESLSANVLELMRKGVTPSQNVNVLRWARFHGLDAAWNILWGFPGETEEDYRQQAALIPLLSHLQPPQNGGRLFMARFSPMFVERAKFKTTFLRPEPGQAHIYPKSVAVDKVAFHFDYAFEDCLPDAAYEGTKARIEEWRAAWQRTTLPRMHYRAYPAVESRDPQRPGAAGVPSAFVVVEDARRRKEPVAHTLEGLAGRLYLACSDHARTAATAAEMTGAPVAEVEAVLRVLCHRGLTMRDRQRYLTLAIPAARPRYAERDGQLVLSLPPDPDVACAAMGIALPSRASRPRAPSRCRATARPSS
ncbi:MAG: RiPP maturation radical SAM protein 1 [Deltaproteobacteria bacterium]|nr:RiPP maturation radical SAM protein 1 [Deltaproteobacteria bacterium]